MFLAKAANYLRMAVDFTGEPMEKFVIEGGLPLHGEVTPGGNKNAALPLLAACLLTEEPVILHNVPHIRDVSDMRHLLESLGVQVEDLGDNSWRITARSIRPADLIPTSAAASVPPSCSRDR
jgi:UDP-N-acetylglucosamine 1-carboxyvinyltransferase